MLLAQAIDGVPVSLSTFWTVIVSLCSVIVAMAKYFYDRSKKCEDWRDAKEPLIQQMAMQLGIAQSANDMVNECPTPGCPFKGKLDAATFSLHTKGKTFSIQEELNQIRKTQITTKL